jgi:hypothetical protein
MLLGHGHGHDHVYVYVYVYGHVYGHDLLLHPAGAGFVVAKARHHAWLRTASAP